MTEDKRVDTSYLREFCELHSHDAIEMQLCWQPIDALNSELDRLRTANAALADSRRYYKEELVKKSDEIVALAAYSERLRSDLEAADACIQEEFNYSNYDHETVCRIGAMWDEAHGIIQGALAAPEAGKGIMNVVRTWQAIPIRHRGFIVSDLKQRDGEQWAFGEALANLPTDSGDGGPEDG